MSVERGGMGCRCWGDRGGRAPPLSAGDAKRCVVMPMPNGWRAAPSLAGEGEGGRIQTSEGRCWITVVADAADKPGGGGGEGGEGAGDRLGEAMPLR